MKKCANCQAITRDNDKYCRNCGKPIKNNKLSLFYSICSFIIISCILFLVILLVASYIVE